MPIQENEAVPLGEIRVSKDRNMVLTVPNVGTSVALIAYDRVEKIGGVAHIILPDSTIAGAGMNKASSAQGVGGDAQASPAKFANEAIPKFIEELLGMGVQKYNLSIKMTGGAQLFNFGGGGNPMNIGSRNAIAVRAALSKLGLAIEKADIGGNKGRQVRLILASGQVIVSQIGLREYTL